MPSPAAPPRALRAWLRALFWALLPIGIIVAIFTGVLRWGEPLPFPRRSIPVESFDRERCTWSCHNHGCRHAPRLPSWLSGDEGLFGQTVHGLHVLGRWAMPHSPRQGYGLVNLVIFCVLWPSLMWGLYLVAIGQRRRLRAGASAAPTRGERTHAS